MAEDNNIPKIWELYGVKENPFSTSPLLVKGGIIPLDSFVGRAEEIKRLRDCHKINIPLLLYYDL